MAMGLIGLFVALGSQVYSIVEAPSTAHQINKRQKRASLFEYETDRFSLGLNPYISHRRIGTSFSLKF